MNIIFLDIDGVLNNDCIFRLKKENIDESCVEFFIDALKEINNVKVVISSTWRIGNKNIFEFENMICQQHSEPLLKILSFLHDDWCTKKLNKIRGNEIEEWLSRHKNVNKFICLDDDNEFLYDLILAYTLKSKTPKDVLKNTNDWFDRQKKQRKTIWLYTKNKEGLTQCLYVMAAVKIEDALKLLQKYYKIKIDKNSILHMHEVNKIEDIWNNWKKWFQESLKIKQEEHKKEFNTTRMVVPIVKMKNYDYKRKKAYFEEWILADAGAEDNDYVVNDGVKEQKIQLNTVTKTFNMDIFYVSDRNFVNDGGVQRPQVKTFKVYDIKGKYYINSDDLTT